MENKVYVLSVYDSSNVMIESFAFSSKEKADKKMDSVIKSYYEEDIKKVSKGTFSGWVEFFDGSELILGISEVKVDE